MYHNQSDSCNINTYLSSLDREIFTAGGLIPYLSDLDAEIPEAVHEILQDPALNAAMPRHTPASEERSYDSQVCGVVRSCYVSVVC